MKRLFSTRLPMAESEMPSATRSKTMEVIVAPSA